MGIDDRLCREYIKENSKVWENEEKIRILKRNEEEKKMERIRRAAVKKGKIREREVQTKITETLRSLPQEERRSFEGEDRRKERMDWRPLPRLKY